MIWSAPVPRWRGTSGRSWCLALLLGCTPCHLCSLAYVLCVFIIHWPSGAID